MRTRSVWFAIVLAGLGWGTGRWQPAPRCWRAFPRSHSLAARFTLATVLVLVWLLVRGEIPRDRPVWRDGAVLGVVNMAMPTFFFTLSLQHLSAGIGGLLIALVPLGTAFWAHWLLEDEPLHTAKIVGMVVALGGVAVLLLSGDVGIPASANLPLGVGLMLIGVTLAALGGTLTRRYAERHRVSDLALPQFLAGAMTAIVVAAFAGELLAGWGFGGDGWAALLYLATVSTVLPLPRLPRCVTPRLGHDGVADRVCGPGDRGDRRRLDPRGNRDRVAGRRRDPHPGRGAHRGAERAAPDCPHRTLSRSISS